MRFDDPPEVGDQWVYVALDADTKLIPTFVVGKRSKKVTFDFIHDLAKRISNNPQITTDGFRFYVESNRGKVRNRSGLRAARKAVWGLWSA